MDLDTILKFSSDQLPAVLAIGAVTVGFIIYYFVMISPAAERRLRKGMDPDTGLVRWTIFQRLWGGFILGLFAILTPIIGLGKAPWDYGMSFAMDGESALIVLVLGAAIVLLNLFRAGKPANLVTYPQIRVPKWDWKLLLGSSFGWVVYLLGYELMFRGFLLYGCIETMGVWPAIAINASIYSFAHFFKGIGETIGAIPFGIIICVITLYTGNFMTAFIVHCFLAISNQTIAAWKHPEIRFLK